MLTVGNVTARSGEIVSGYLSLGSRADGSRLSLPVMIAAGMEKGPVLWLSACVHGDEVGGAAAVMELFSQIDLKQIKGSIIGVPVTNPLAFCSSSRNTPLDGANLNRVFPGSMEGTYSYQLAYVLQKIITENADCVIDLHSGGMGLEVPFYVIYDDDGGEIGRKAKELSKHCGVSLIWRVQGEAGLGGSLTVPPTLKGIPSLTVECGGGPVKDEDIANYHKAISGVMQSIGMLPGTPPRQQKYCILSGGQFVSSTEGGLFMPQCSVGDVLPPGSTIGHILNPFSKKVESIMSPSSEQTCITALRFKYFPVAAGDLIAEAIPVETEE